MLVPPQNLGLARGHAIMERASPEFLPPNAVRCQEDAFCGISLGELTPLPDPYLVGRG